MLRRTLSGLILIGGLLVGCGAPATPPPAPPAPTLPSPADPVVGPTATPVATPVALTNAPVSPPPGSPPPAPTARPTAMAPTSTPAEGTRATAEEGSGSPESLLPTATPSPPARRPAGRRVIALDPGHGGPEVGAVSPEGDLREKDVNLQIALKLAARLRATGFAVVLTRDSDRAVSPLYRGGGYAGGLQYDLQARIDIANNAGADLFLSIHNNGGPPGESGTEVWYNRDRPFADRNLALARLVQTHLVQAIRALGYPVRDRGIKDDSHFRVFRGRTYNIYVLGPGTGPRPHPPTQMPGVLGESLFLSHPGDAAMLRQERTLEAIAQGYHRAIQAYFQAYPD